MEPLHFSQLCRAATFFFLSLSRSLARSTFGLSDDFVRFGKIKKKKLFDLNFRKEREKIV
jgi:hypothetical protein